MSPSSLLAGNRRADQHCATLGIDPMHSEYIFGEIYSNSDNGHGLPLSSELMRRCTSHRDTWLPFAARPRLARDGEVPFIR